MVTTLEPIQKKQTNKHKSRPFRIDGISFAEMPHSTCLTPNISMYTDILTCPLPSSPGSDAGWCGDAAVSGGGGVGAGSGRSSAGVLRGLLLQPGGGHDPRSSGQHPLRLPSGRVVPARVRPQGAAQRGRWNSRDWLRRKIKEVMIRQWNQLWKLKCMCML